MVVLGLVHRAAWYMLSKLSGPQGPLLSKKESFFSCVSGVGAPEIAEWMEEAVAGPQRCGPWCAQHPGRPVLTQPGRCLP